MGSTYRHLVCIQHLVKGNAGDLILVRPPLGNFLLPGAEKKGKCSEAVLHSQVTQLASGRDEPAVGPPLFLAYT